MDFKSNWRKKARIYLAEAFGGACTICGYDKCTEAIDYHHINPKEKDAMLSSAMRNGHAWSKIVIEARKCTILCCRCHRELHAGMVSLPLNPARFNEEYADVIALKKALFNSCPKCGKEKLIRYQFCSQHCSAEAVKRFNPSKDELAVMVNDMPMTKIGKLFGVSDKAIKKRCVRLGIELPNRQGFWSGKLRT